MSYSLQSTSGPVQKSTAKFHLEIIFCVGVSTILFSVTGLMTLLGETIHCQLKRLACDWRRLALLALK